MQSAEHSICGLIEFEPEEARLALRTRHGSDETLHATLLSLAQELFGDTSEPDSSEWVSETILTADVESLEQDLLLIYRRIERRPNPA
jgi:hypothetical protein